LWNWRLHSEDLGLGSRIILKRILMKYDAKISNTLI
jgi:hypothetical protein